MSNVVNLDDDRHDETIILVTFRGAKIAVSKARLHDLLATEQRFAAFLAGAPALDTHTLVTAHDSKPLGATPVHTQDSITHASLSTRIKKIFDYSRGKQELRPAQAQFLRDIINTFDWVIPEHANTRLDEHIAEMSNWTGVSAELRELMEAFLERYRTSRRHSRRDAG